MYICEQCNKQVEKSVPINRIVVEKRQTEYFEKETGIKQGEGYETVKEIVVCLDCKISFDKKEQEKATRL